MSTYICYFCMESKLWKSNYFKINYKITNAVAFFDKRVCYISRETERVGDLPFENMRDTY